MNWKEIAEYAKEGFKIGLPEWHMSQFWPVDNVGNVVIGDLNKFNPALFNRADWVFLVDNHVYIKNIINDDCYERLDNLNEVYQQIVEKMEWFIGPGKVARNPMLMENFEMFIGDQLKKIKELSKTGDV